MASRIRTTRRVHRKSGGEQPAVDQRPAHRDLDAVQPVLQDRDTDRQRNQRDRHQHEQVVDDTHGRIADQGEGDHEQCDREQEPAQLVAFVGRPPPVAHGHSRKAADDRGQEQRDQARPPDGIEPGPGQRQAERVVANWVVLQWARPQRDGDHARADGQARDRRHRPPAPGRQPAVGEPQHAEGEQRDRAADPDPRRHPSRGKRSRERSGPVDQAALGVGVRRERYR